MEIEVVINVVDEADMSPEQRKATTRVKQIIAEALRDEDTIDA